MAMDGLMLYRITHELNELCPGKINKIQNISNEEILFQLHTRNQGKKRLVFNVHSNTNRVYLTNPMETTRSTPSNFVMVLRKQCAQAIIESIEQKNFDRILCIHLSTRNELGDLILLSLYVELMGKYANMVLVNQNNIIIDALKRIPVYENSKRYIHPGATYSLPVQPDKQDPTKVKGIDPDTSLVKQIYGFSPVLSMEFQYRMQQKQSYQDILNELLHSRSLYVYDHDFHCLPLTHLKQEPKVYPLMEGLKQLNQDAEQKMRIKQQCGDVFHTVEKEKKKMEKKLPKLIDSLERSKNYKQYREYGDLLFAYMGQIKKEQVVQLPAFETGQLISIPLDMRLDIKGNANKYYQKYHKLKRSQSILKEQIEQCEKDMIYINQLYEQLQHCSIEDALEIRDELIQNRYLINKKKTKGKKKKKPNILHLQLDDCDIFIGKNNLQNNYITHQLSRKTDYWFHVKDYHGSHVLLKTDNPTETQIRMCAGLAAYFSKGKLSSSVPVDYCPIHQLKKVPGSAVGFVTMKSYNTIYIDPEQNVIENWIQTYKV